LHLVVYIGILLGAHPILHISRIRVNNSVPNLSFLESRAERRQKSISVEFSFVTIFVFNHHVSATYVTVLLTIA
jgi:hypothetical protein